MKWELTLYGWLGSWVVSVLTQAQKTRVQIAAATLSGNSLRQTVHTHCAPVHQAAKLVAALLRLARVTAGLVDCNGSLPPGLWFTSPAGWLPRTVISSGTLCLAFKYGLPLPFIPIRHRWDEMPCHKMLFKFCYAHYPKTTLLLNFLGPISSLGE